MENNEINIAETELGRRLAQAQSAKAENTEVVVGTEVVENTEVVEAAVETTETQQPEVVNEVVETTEQTEVVVEPKKALDLLKDEEDVAVEAKKEFSLNDLPAEIQKEIEFAKKLKANPLLELFEKGATAEDLVEFAKSLIPTDNSNVPLADLIKKDFESDLGLSGEDLDTAVAEYLDEVQSMPLWKQKQTEKAIRDKYKPTASNPNDFLSKWREVSEANKPAPQPSEAEMIKEIETISAGDKSQISEIGTNLVGAEFEGVQLTENEVKAIVDEYNFEEVNIKYLGKDGKFNAKKYIQDKLQTNPVIIEKRIEVAVAKERAKLLKEFGGVERVVPNGGDFKQGEQPINQTKAVLQYLLPHAKIN